MQANPLFFYLLYLAGTATQVLYLYSTFPDADSHLHGRGQNLPVNHRPELTVADETLLVPEGHMVQIHGVEFFDVEASRMGRSTVSVMFDVAVGDGVLVVHDDIRTAYPHIAVMGDDSSTLVLTGSLQDINSLVQSYRGITLIPDPTFTGTMEIDIQIDDLGNWGADPGTSGGAHSETAVATLGVHVVAAVDVEHDTSKLLNAATFDPVDALGVIAEHRQGPLGPDALVAADRRFLRQLPTIIRCAGLRY